MSTWTTADIIADARGAYFAEQRAANLTDEEKEILEKSDPNRRYTTPLRASASGSTLTMPNRVPTPEEAAAWLAEIDKREGR